MILHRLQRWFGRPRSLRRFLPNRQRFLPVFMPPQRFAASAKAILDGVNVLGQFVSAECRDTYMRYACGSYLMPCVTYDHDGTQYSLPRLPCRSECETFMAACGDDLIAIEHIMHAVPAMRSHTAKLYDTFCDLTVDGHCNGEPDAPLCYGEHFRGNSPASYVDIFQRQQAHPVEGSLLPDGGFISCASNNAAYVPTVDEPPKLLCETCTSIGAGQCCVEGVFRAEVPLCAQVQACGPWPTLAPRTLLAYQHVDMCFLLPV